MQAHFRMVDWHNRCVEREQNVRDICNDMGAWTQGFGDVRDALRELMTLTEE